MRSAAVFVLMVLSLLLALTVTAGWSSERAVRVETARGQAEALVIRAQGQAALDRAQASQLIAQASALTLLAAVPWGALTCLGVLGLGVLALAAAIITRPAPAPRVIEHHIVYLPAPGQSRRQLWNSLSQQPQLRSNQTLKIINSLTEE